MKRRKVYPDEYSVQYIGLPLSVKGMTVIDENDFANIYINKDLLYEQRQAALRHELHHLEYGDAWNDDGIQTIEARANA